MNIQNSSSAAAGVDQLQHLNDDSCRGKGIASLPWTHYAIHDGHSAKQIERLCRAP